MNELFSQFHFARPLWLLVLVPVAILCWLLIFRRQHSAWHQICDKHLLAHISTASKAHYLKNWIIPALLAVLIVALSGPTWRKAPLPSYESKDGLIIALDLSKEMLADDVKPNRITRARHKITDLLALRDEGLTGLIVFTREAFTVVPMTEDTNTIQNLLPVLEPSLMPVSGKDIDAAITLSSKLLQQSGLHRGNILLITNGEAHQHHQTENPPPNYHVSVLGIGTKQGSAIDIGQGKYLTNKQDEILISKLNANTLRQLTRRHNGAYHSATHDDTDIRYLLTSINAPITKNGSFTNTEHASHWQDDGFWLLFILAPLILVLFQRGVVISILLLPIFYLPPADAFELHNMFLNHEQQAIEAFRNGEYDKASKLTDKSLLKGLSKFKEGKLDEAINRFSQNQSSEGYYNLANSYVHKSMLKEAIAAYDKALNINPDNKSARINKSLVEEYLKNQQKQSQSKQQNTEKQNEQQTKADESDESSSKANSSTQEDNKSQEQTNRSQEDQDDHTAKKQQKQYKDAHQRQLERVRDDPGGLLRRKFLHEYQQRLSRQ